MVSGRGLADARSLARIEGIAYAGNHGMEIEGPGVSEVHAEAAATRPLLSKVAALLGERLGEVDGAFVEDKGLTLSVHYRLAAPEVTPTVREAVEAAVAAHAGLRVTEGKKVLEIRPRVEWHKGKAVEFLLAHLKPPQDAPILYIGDDTTDEDAFRAVSAWRGGAGEGILVTPDPTVETAATSYMRAPEEVAHLLTDLADAAG